MTRSAYLRVYLPDGSAGLRGLRRRSPDVATRPALRSGEFGLLSEPMLEDALEVEWGGRRFVCPRFPRLRMLEGVLAFHRAYGDLGGEAIIPESAARRAAEQLRALHDRRPQVRSHILTSPWHVPLRWFVAFDASERELVGRSDGPSIRYRSDRKSASDRIETALEVLREAGMDDVITDDLAELAGWLGDFPPEAMVELDYGGVALMFDRDELESDESAASVWASIEALASEDWETAGEHYTAVASRWAPALAVTYCN